MPPLRECAPREEYTLMDLGRSRSDLVTGIWNWAEANIEPVEAARAGFDRASNGGIGDGAGAINALLGSRRVPCASRRLAPR
jgi:hypothetical protein